MRRILVLAALAAIVGVGVWAIGRPRAPAAVAWQGYAEADFVKVGPTQQGLLTAVQVERGDQVVKGQPLFEQDDADDRAAVDQARRLLQQAENQLANLNSPAKPTEIEQAEANLRDAEAARDRAQEDLRRNAALLRSGSATKQIVDQEEADLRSSEAKVAAATAALATAKAPMGRPAEIDAQASMVDSLRAALKHAEWRLAQRSVVSPVSGVVADVIARPGETLAAGAPVVSLLPPQNIFVRFFIPEAQLINVHVGDAVRFECDNCRDDLVGTVSFIAPQAEFTPPFIFSEQTRTKFVFLAEARSPAEQAAVLNPGQPVTVTPRTDAR
ncbi:MAG TPA: HlyD family efflux transporter periplasmic adaptor subunit [Roseiarcus sp.]|jgi:HlyD family secretion protein